MSAISKVEKAILELYDEPRTFQEYLEYQDLLEWVKSTYVFPLEYTDFHLGTEKVKLFEGNDSLGFHVFLGDETEPTLIASHHAVVRVVTGNERLEYFDRVLYRTFANGNKLTPGGACAMVCQYLHKRMHIYDGWLKAKWKATRHFRAEDWVA